MDTAYVTEDPAQNSLIRFSTSIKKCNFLRVPLPAFQGSSFWGPPAVRFRGLSRPESFTDVVKQNEEVEPVDGQKKWEVFFG